MPTDKEKYLALVNRLGVLLERFKEMSVPDYLREMQVSSLPGRVPDYSGFREAIYSDEVIQSEPLLFGMAYLFYEVQFKGILDAAQPHQAIADVTDAFLKAKLLHNLEEHLSPALRAMFAEFRAQEGTSSGEPSKG